MDRLLHALEQPAVLHDDVRLVGHLRAGRRRSRAPCAPRAGRPAPAGPPAGRRSRSGRPAKPPRARSSAPTVPAGGREEARLHAAERRAAAARAHRLQQPRLRLVHHRRAPLRRWCMSDDLQVVVLDEGHARRCVKSTTRATSVMTEVNVSSKLHEAARHAPDLGEDGGLVELAVQQLVHAAQDVDAAARGASVGRSRRAAGRCGEDVAHQLQDALRLGVLGDVVVGARSPGPRSGRRPGPGW